MKDTRKCSENRQLHKEGYLQEDRVELEGNAGALSIFSTSEKEANDGKGYAMGLLEEILDRDNMNKAFKRVKSNKGKPGIGGMTVDELLPFLKENGDQIKQAIMEGTYSPKPVRKVEIPKPDGGIRLLGIPTVLERFLEEELKLKVNKEKSAVDRPWKLKFLGFSFYYKKGEIGIRVHPKSVKKLKSKLKAATGRSNAMSVREDCKARTDYYRMGELLRNCRHGETS